MKHYRHTPITLTRFEGDWPNKPIYKTTRTLTRWRRFEPAADRDAHLQGFCGLNRFIELRAESPGVGRLWGQLPAKKAERPEYRLDSGGGLSPRKRIIFFNH